jgi:hypothetical protein
VAERQYSDRPRFHSRWRWWSVYAFVEKQGTRSGIPISRFHAKVNATCTRW